MHSHATKMKAVAEAIASRFRFVPLAPAAHAVWAGDACVDAPMKRRHVEHARAVMMRPEAARKLVVPP